VEISEATQVPLAKWPLWTWFAYPALAIAIGGGLGIAVANIRQHREPRPVHTAATIEPIVAAPQPSIAAPSPEIEIDPDPIKAVAPRQKTKKPVKSARCNVYDHMNGC
jgi:hypothetical protein